MRKLASIQTIKSIEPIFKDGVQTSLSTITFENIAWQCVGKTTEYKVGDKVLYIEISTVLPEHPVFEFMRPRKFKLQTARILGTVSQGLVMPLSTLAEFWEFVDGQALEDGLDVTPLVGVKRYEPELDYKTTGSGGAIAPFPTDIVPKTDELRLQSFPFLLEEMKVYDDVIATVKLDGTSTTFFWDFEKGEVAVCGRNIRKLSDDGSVYFHALRGLPANFGDVLRIHNIVVQGEICAPKIQKNRLGLKRAQFFAFSVFDRSTFQYMASADASELLWSYFIPEVPAAHFWSNGEFQKETVESLLEKAKGFYKGTENHREGIVVRPRFDSAFSVRAGTMLSFKVINDDYLLTGGE